MSALEKWVFELLLARRRALNKRGSFSKEIRNKFSHWDVSSDIATVP